MQPLARKLLAFTLLAAVVVACSDDDPTGTNNSPLAGLQERDGNDSVGNPIPTPPAQPTPGIFRGTVLGPSTPGTGGDTLATAPRVAGVVVTAYPRLNSNLPPEVGPAAATVTTGADGKFELPTLTGEFVVTFTPPATSEYGGVWVTASTSTQSVDYPWWVVLWKK